MSRGARAMLGERLVSPVRFAPLARFAPAALAVLPVAISAACYGPTQMQVEVLTDLACAEEPRSAIFVAGDDEPIGDTGDEACKSGAPMSSLGDVVFTPGSRAGRSSRVTVKVRLAYGRDAAGNRRQPRDCDRDPSACAFASRTFTYVEHEARRAPVRLYRDCLGKVCGEGTTCIQGGQCVPDAVVCAGGDCVVPGEAATSTGSDGGAADGAPPADAGGEAGVSACALPAQGGDVLVDANMIPRKATASSTAFYWVEQTTSGPASSVIRKLARGSATPTNATAAPLSGVVEALAAVGDELWFVWRSNGATHELVANGAPVSLSQWPAVSDMVLAPLPGGGRRAYMSVPTEGKVVYHAPGDGPFELIVLGAEHVTFDAQRAYARASSGVLIYDLTAPKASPTVHEPQSVWNALGTNGTAAFGTMSSGAGGIDVRSISPNPALLGRTLSAPTGKLTADATHAYWVEDVNDDWQIRRLAHAPLPLVQLQAEVVRRFGAVEIADLYADPAAAGCLYYWQGTRLRVAQKVVMP